MIYRRGAVAAGHKLTAEAAEIVLREGGNAFDALISAITTACVVEPSLASLGGGGFAIVRATNQKPKIFDFFNQTPRKKCADSELDSYFVDIDFGVGFQKCAVGLGSCATPGIVAGLFAIHETLATMPMHELLFPSIKFASTGVRVTGFQSYAINLLKVIYCSDSNTFQAFSSPNNSSTLINEGELLQQTHLADAIEALSYEGPDLFYRGEIGQRLVNDMLSGGHLTIADLENYKAEVRTPIEVSHRAWHVFTNPPPASGGLLTTLGLKLLTLATQEQYHLGTSEYLHRLCQVIRRTSDLQTKGSARSEILPDMSALEADFITAWREQIQPLPATDRGTTHISIIDAAGNQVAATLSNGEGSGYIIPGTGIMINNLLDGKDSYSGPSSHWAPDSRLSSILTPTLLLNKEGKTIALGSGGATQKFTALLQVLTNLVDYEMDCDQAISAPRIHLDKEILLVEEGFDLVQINPFLETYPDYRLFRKHHPIFGGVNVVMHDGIGFQGSGDQRRDGAFIVI